jgi:hypothetical protein
MGSCPEPKIDIGDYEYHLEEWNRQNMLDYQIELQYRRYLDIQIKAQKEAVITVKNGIPESSDPPEWLTSGEMSTVPEIYSFIKEEAERLKNTLARKVLFVEYNTVYHYPKVIRERSMGIAGETDPFWVWTITLTPPEENEQETGNGEE